MKRLGVYLVGYLIVLLLPILSSDIMASPLPAGTLLTINPGSGNSGMFSTSLPGTGSAFSMKCCDPKPLWTDIPRTGGGAGTDGGIIVGTNQSSGGQELTTSSASPGGIDAAWYFFSIYGTDFTPAGVALNRFADTPCIAGLGTTACTDATGDPTTLGSWQIAWNGNSIPMGGGKIDAWIVSGTSYTLNYRSTVPPGDPSGFGGVPYGLHLEGSLVGSGVTPQPTLPPPTPTATRTPTNTPTPTSTPTPVTPLPESGLPMGTLLTINPGVGNSGMFSTKLPGTGSAFSMLCCGPTPLWTDISSPALGGSGTDGGIVVGTSQTSGGQELTTGSTASGGIDAPWYFFGSYGTDATPAGAALNRFADTSCTAGLGTTACTDATGDPTTIGSWKIAWNGVSVPMGGGKVSKWLVSGNLYTLDYRATVPPGDPSGFGGVPYGLHFEGGIVVPATPTPTPTPTNTPTPTPTPTPVGVPKLSGAIAAKGPQSPGVLFVDLRLTNVGTGGAFAIKVNQFAFRTLAGSGTVTYNTSLSPALPIALGSLAVGASATTRIYLNVPGTVTRFSMEEKGGMRDAVGTIYTFSLGQAIFP